MKLKKKVVCKECGKKLELYHDLREHVKLDHAEYWTKVKAFVEETKEAKINE